MGRSPPIVHFIPSLETGGAERICVDLANAMAARGLDVHVITAGRAGARGRELSTGVRLHEIGARGVATSVPSLARLTRAIRPAAVIAFMDHANLAAWLALRLARSPARLVFSTHIDFAHAFGELAPPLRRIVLAAYSTVYPRADFRVAVSAGVADSVARALRVPRETIDVVHNPIAAARIRALTLEAVPAAIRIDPDAALIVGIGRLVPQKDFTTLLDAVAQAGRSTRLQLVILGEGPERSRLEDHAVSLGIAERVQFPGFLANPYPVLARARVFVSSSRFEGFGIAIVEAMTLRVPVVATDCRSGPAEILGHGSFGRLVPVGDSAALAAAIGAALADPGPVAEAARSATEYDVARVADRYLALLGTAPAEPE